MTDTNLSQNEFIAAELIENGITSQQLADELEISLSYVYDIIQQLRSKDYEIVQDQHGNYMLSDTVMGERPMSVSEESRINSGEKSAITRRVNKFLAEMEHQLVDRLEDTEPQMAEGGLTQREEGADLILHCTDDHFGEVIENQYGDEVFNVDMAEGRVEKRFTEAIRQAGMWRDAGYTFDTANLLLGGDMVTNENIYDGQAGDIEMNVREQIETAAEVYIDGIKALADEFPSVQVVCQVGNHGRMQGADANADGILYGMMDRVLRESDYTNITFRRSNRTYYIDFQIRDWNAHLRHGHDSSLEHIGTSAGKQRWLTWLYDHDFDVAFRGHYHTLKEEPIMGKPVHMGGSIIPQSEFEESHALASRPASAVYVSTDREPTEHTSKIYFG